MMRITHQYMVKNQQTLVLLSTRTLATQAVAAAARTIKKDDRIILEQLRTGQISSHQLERELGDTSEAVRIRRQFVQEQYIGKSFSQLPQKGKDFNDDEFYSAVNGVNAESVIGFLPLPVGVVGPLKVNGQDYMVPLATTEGALIASTNRGARAIHMGGGAFTAILRDGMTRSPVLSFPSSVAAADFARWIEHPERHEMLSKWFAETTRFGKFASVKASVVGRNVFLRVRCTTGDAMGMNMVGKGVNRIIEHLINIVPGLELVALSGNTCTDKKPSAVNWIEGRGKSVIAEVVLPASIVSSVLKTNIPDLCRVAVKKNLIGSSVAGSIGGNNAHAANVVTGIFLATGQDPAQNVASSNCMTLFEPIDNGEAVHCSVTMPSLEVGTIGGGTVLAAQSACLDMLGVRGSSKEDPGSNAKTLASIIAASVLAGELSLNAALASNHLISAHMALNRRHDRPGTTPGNGDVGVSSVGSGNQDKRTSHKTAPQGDKTALGQNVQVRRFQGKQVLLEKQKQQQGLLDLDADAKGAWNTPRLTIP
jgi:hydroxymethylglutaryl-CoA reductase (NADPH)